MPALWKRPIVYLYLIPFVLLYLITNQNALFWDTTQFAGDHPNWYYFQNFKYFLLPDSCDSGHPPAFGMYLALAWKCFGRSLWVSHTAMLPFVVVIVYQAVRTGVALIPDSNKFAHFLTTVILSIAALLSQCTLVSPDIWVIAAFLLTFNGIIQNHNYKVLIGVLFLAIISSRAMMAGFCLYLFALSYYYHYAEFRWFTFLHLAWRKVLVFLPGGALAVAFFAYHYYAKGWIGYHKDMPWAAGFEIVSASKMIRHIGILIWRIVDIGNLLTVLIAFIGIVFWYKGGYKVCSKQQQRIAASLILLVSVLFLFTALPLVIYTNLLTHRYFLPLNITIAITAMYLLYLSNVPRKNLIALVMILLQLSGHFWTYPQQISQGWDSTLGHLPFYKMRKEFKHYMQQKGIAKSEVATTPSLMQSDFLLDMATDTVWYKDAQVDTAAPFIWYCNVSNVLNKKVNTFTLHYDTLKYEKRGNVVMVLFERKTKN